MPRRIHNFTISGIIGDDSHIVKARENYEKILIQQMRDKGYVPVLDMLPQFKISYVEAKNQYGFILTLYGIFIGKSKVDNFIGFSGQDFIPR